MHKLTVLVQFIFLGLLTAAIGEWQFSVFLRNDLHNFVGSLVFNTIYMSAVYLTTLFLLTTIRNRPKFIVVYAGFFGLMGLMVEWFLIGNSPWGNPNANQLGMFAYWACMALVPLCFLLKKRRLQVFISFYALIYTVLVVFGEMSIPSSEGRFVFHIYAVIFGYTGLMLSIIWKYLGKNPAA